MNSTQVMKAIKKWIALYLGAVSCIVIPLYMKNGYIRLIYWKAHQYLLLAVPAVCIAAVVSVVDLFLLLRSKNTDRANGAGVKNSGGNPLIRKPETSLVILTSIAVWSLVSTFMSQNHKLSLLGTIGWSVGSLMTLVLVMSTIIISQNIIKIICRIYI